MPALSRQTRGTTDHLVWNYHATNIQKENHWEAEERIFREPYDINFANIN